MKISKFFAVLAMVIMTALPMAASAAVHHTVAGEPAAYNIVTDKQPGLDLSYFQVEHLKNITARHAINRGIINAVGDLIMQHKSELDAGNCDMKITSDIKYNGFGILSATFTSEGTIKGAAHGFKAMNSINYNYLTGEEITAEALNKLYVAAKENPAYTVKNINKLLKEEAASGQLDLITGFKGVKTLPPFYLSGDDMDINAFFQPYEVAPYAAGIVVLPIK